MKSFFASKTNWLGILTFVAGLAAISDQLPPQAAKWLLLVVAVANIALRTFYTSTRIGGAE